MIRRLIGNKRCLTPSTEVDRRIGPRTILATGWLTPTVRGGKVIGCCVSRCTAITVPPLQRRHRARLQLFPSVRAGFAEHAGQARRAQHDRQQFRLVRAHMWLKLRVGLGMRLVTTGSDENGAA